MKRSNLRPHHKIPLYSKASEDSVNTACYITLVTHRQVNLLGEITNSVMCLNRLGEIVQASWQRLSNYFPIQQDSWVIMPNHLHAILWILNLDNRKITYDQNESEPWRSLEIVLPQQQPDGIVENSLSAVVEHFKSVTSRRIRQCQVSSPLNSNGRQWESNSNGSSTSLVDRIWQRNFYSQILHNEDEIRKFRQYISENPHKWCEDEDNIRTPAI
jgi:REP-associated tyrosine transposase